MGLVPKSAMWRIMRLFAKNTGMRSANFGKYHASRLLGDRHTQLQSHAAFAFLLDYVPNWKWAYGAGGLIQYQSLVPASSAEAVFRDQIELQHRYGLPAYLGVFKRHRPDAFLMTHALDGYSLALDLKVTRANRERLWRMAAEMDRLVVEAGGRFYFAKDSTLSPASLTSYLAEERVQRFLALKRELDPGSLLQTDYIGASSRRGEGVRRRSCVKHITKRTQS